MKTELAKTAAIDGKLETMVESAYPDLNFIDEWRLSRKTSKLLSGKMEKIVADMLEAQKQHLEHKLMIQLDLSKKSEYAKYQKAVNQLNQSIIDASEEIDRELSNILMNGQEIIFQQYKVWQEKLKAFEEDEEFYQKAYETARTHIFKALDALEDKVNRTIETSKHSLEATIELLKL